MIFQENLGEDGFLDAVSLQSLESHCTSCRDCRTLRALESALTIDLRSVHSLQETNVHVADAVIAMIREEPVPAVSSSPTNGFGWAIAAAATGSAGIIALTLTLAPSVAPVLGPMFRGLGTLVKSATPLLALAGVVSRFLKLAAQGLLSLAPVLEALAPVAWFAVCTGALLALISSLVIVGRDLSRSPQPALRKER
jgi:hypothetical protein